MANSKVAKNQGRSKQGAEAPVDSEIRRAAERIGYEPETEQEAFDDEPADGETCDPHSLALTEEPTFRGDDVNPDATVGTLIAAMFEAPNGSTVFADPQALLRNLTLCAADEFYMIEMAAIGADRGGGMLGVEIQRFALRSQWRLRLGLELHDRIKATMLGKVAS
jgi:hypothetical protein